MFVDMWKELMGDTTYIYETSESFLNLYVHYKLEEDNAFFDGKVFKFGDGKDYYYPLVSLDVVCHEIGHAITRWHGGRMQNRNQQGGVNEAYSDIVGETCDIHYHKKEDALIGSDITKGAKAMRSMCNPTSLKTDKSVDHMCKYKDGMDAHHSSGIYNKAWCILKSTHGWDYAMAFKAFTIANLLYWRPAMTMHCGACGVESAAEDLTYDVADVTAAFNAVGVSCDKC
ncbi:elastase-like [Watersipora subatra]|uniref:elastase-like n=1 Tax=Watersipora subatra TaxID=2589382 RepID=UPI00355B17A3